MCYIYFGNQYFSCSIDRIATEVDLNRKKGFYKKHLSIFQT